MTDIDWLKKQRERLAAQRASIPDDKEGLKARGRITKRIEEIGDEIRRQEQLFKH